MSAQLAPTSTPASIYQFVGKNLAPRKPLLELANKKAVPSPNKLCDALKKKFDELMNRDTEVWREQIDAGRMVANADDGKLLLLRSARDGALLFRKRDGKFSDNKTTGGLFHFFITKLLSEWLSSRPEIDPVYTSSDDQIEEFMSGVKTVQDQYESRFFNNDYETMELRSAVEYGTWVTRYRYDPEKQDIVCELLPFPACRWDVRFKAEESSYFIYQSRCPKSLLSTLLGDVEIPTDSYDGEYQDYGLRSIEMIAKQGSNIAGDGKEWTTTGDWDNDAHEATVIEMWLQPSQYMDIDLENEEDTVSGIKLSKGQSLLETFPTGMCVVGVAGMKQILAIYPEDHKDHIVSALYHSRSYTGLGQGVSSAVDLIKDANDLHSQLLTAIKTHSTPGWGYNQDLVSEQDAKNIGKPRKAIPFNFKNAPDGVNSVNQAIQAIAPSAPANAAFEYAERLKEMLQYSFQVTNFSDAFPGVKNNTATGAEIGQEESDAMLVPQHLNKAEHRKKSAKVYFNLFRRFCNTPKFFSTNDLNGITKGKYFTGPQFAGIDVDFEIVSNSQIPRSPFANERSLSRLFLQTGGLPGLIQAYQASPELTESVVTAFGVKVPLPKKMDIARVCRRRIEQARSIVGGEMALQASLSAVSGQPFDNSQLAQTILAQVTPPIVPAEPYHRMKAEWLGELLDTDELSYGPAQLRQVVEAMLWTHLQCEAQFQGQSGQLATMAQMQAMAPQVLAEQMLQQGQQQQQSQQDAQGQASQGNQQLQLEGQKAGIANQTSQADHGRALELQDRQHAQTMEEKAADQKHQIALAKLKPKGK